MNFMPSSERLKLLEHIHAIRFELAEWVFAEIRLTAREKNQSASLARDMASLLHDHFRNYDGWIVLCGTQEILMVIRWGAQKIPEILLEEIKGELPEGICEVDVFPPNKAGLRRLELSFAALDTNGNNYLLTRQLRQENVVMIADDDPLIRRLMRKINDDNSFQTIEADKGTLVPEKYFEHLPDVLFLDLHFPDCMGFGILGAILEKDPDAHIVMLSADSSRENVQTCIRNGAQGFLAKPVTRAKVLQQIRKCQTIYTTKRQTISGR